MKILGIETSCDETAVSLVEDGKYILSNVINSQIKVHKVYGGVVPEIASRQHLLSLIPVIDEAICEHGSFECIDAIAVTNGPGLVGALLVGVQGAKTLSYVLNKPLIPVNHLEAHLKAPFVGWKNEPPPEPKYPQLALLVSGGHTILFYVTENKREIVGATRDDAAGEAFDKVAKMLKMGYPGGQIIDENSKKGDQTKYRLPRGLHKKGGYDYSFSGLKTSVLYLLKKLGDDVEDELFNICASFQAAAIDSLIGKIELALENYEVKSLVFAGGVAANSYLRDMGKQTAEKFGVEFVVPPKILCTDNAAMVASLGFDLYNEGILASLDLNAFASSAFSRRGELIRKTMGR
jgi:tRNA N6-adenosine threonylcarbamoyltransferase